MKNYISKATLVAFAMGLFFVFSACEKQDLTADVGSSDVGVVLDVDQNDRIDRIINLPDNVRKGIEQRATTRGLDLNLMEEKVVTRPTGEVEKVYVVEGDIEMTPHQFREMMMEQDGDRQYSTNITANPNQTYTVIGYTGSCCALTSRMRTALSWAVANYNRENLNISLSLSYSSGTNADIVVYNNGASGGGGSAGFPYSNGDPYKWVQINAGTDAFGTNVVEHVICHEIGHCLGFRHTDWYNRSISCGSGGSEGSAGVGANLIPGTPSLDNQSIMLSCFSSNEDGEFSNLDVVALEYLF